MMLTYYHNPRCSKSREGLAILEKTGQNFELIKYLETPLNKQEIKALLKKLNISAITLVRKNEQVWKDNFKDKSLSEDDIIDAMVTYPKLIERPIVVKNNQAIIGRPPQNIIDFLKEK